LPILYETDIFYNQDTIGALCGDETFVYVVFEDRGDCCWGTLQHFWRATESAGLAGDPTPLEDVLIGGKARQGPGRPNDSERLLLRLRRVRATPER
jgi:hypothetical protein|tara:strand:- start:2405 stop:2692 length:288 start_codon:yes stop_codon:yes gene_type:complete